MRNIKIVSLVFLFLVLLVESKAQSSEVKSGNSYFAKSEYFRALQAYDAAIQNGEDLDIPAQINRAHCYYYLNNIDKAYELFALIQADLKGPDLFIYASTMQKFGFYQGAIELYKKAKEQKGGNPEQIDELIKSCQWALENSAFGSEYLVNPSELMTYGQSFGIQYFKDGVVYSSSSGKSSDQVDRQGMTFLNLYFSEIKEGKLQEKNLFSENLVFNYHVGAISFTSDHKTMFFTKSVRVAKGKSRIKIFSVEYDGQDWGNEKELSFNSNDYDCAHPALTPDDKYLIFVSNIKGGYGQKDLYVSERSANGEFSSPKNMGPEINSFGDEVFPFVSKDYVLYFSSDGQIGFGGLDLYKAGYEKEMTWSGVENMMQPFNSSKDDFGYVIDPGNPNQGFLSSNRTSAGNQDFIFYVEPLVNNAEADKIMGGILFDERDQLSVGDNLEKDFVEMPDAFSTRLTSTFKGSPVEGASVVVRNAFDGSPVAEGLTDAKGDIFLVLPNEMRWKGQDFEIEISKEGQYNSQKMVVNITELEAIAKNGLMLTPIFNDQVLDDIGTMVIPYRNEIITPEGIEVLERLAAYLALNPNVVIKLNGHTDARGDKYNNLLTSKRAAEKAVKYLMEKGIDETNLIPRGYGERYLLNQCRRGKWCDEETHLKNMRIEVVVWRMLD